jgi:hypothetical protein
MSGQQSLNNFYKSVQFRDPKLATLMSEDVFLVSLHAVSQWKSTTGQEAADRLRRRSLGLPVVLRQVLDNSLADMGYMP